MRIVARGNGVWIVELTDTEIMDVAHMEPPNSLQIGEVYSVSKWVKLAHYIKEHQLTLQGSLDQMKFAAAELLP